MQVMFGGVVSDIYAFLYKKCLLLHPSLCLAESRPMHFLRCGLALLHPPVLEVKKHQLHRCCEAGVLEPAKGFEPLAYGLRSHFLVFVSFHEKPERLLS